MQPTSLMQRGLIETPAVPEVPSLIRRACRNGILRYLAGISYALYVWHPMTALGLLGTGGGWERYLIKRPISFALTFLLAHVSTNTLEGYFIRLARWSKVT